MSGKNPRIPTVVFPTVTPMEHLLFPGEAAGPREFFLFGWWQQQVEWLFCLLSASFSTALTPVLVPPD